MHVCFFVSANELTLVRSTCRRRGLKDCKGKDKWVPVMTSFRLHPFYDMESVVIYYSKVACIKTKCQISFEL